MVNDKAVGFNGCSGATRQPVDSMAGDIRVVGHPEDDIRWLAVSVAAAILRQSCFGAGCSTSPELHRVSWPSGTFTRSAGITVSCHLQAVPTAVQRPPQHTHFPVVTGRRGVMTVAAQLGGQAAAPLSLHP